MSENKKYYITTPIYYPSGKFHIGTAYSTTVADTIKRYKELRGFETYFLTGLDEHGQKIQIVAEKRGLTPQEHVDEMAENAEKLWKFMDIRNDDFIRTTEDRHVRIVEDIFEVLMNTLNPMPEDIFELVNTIEKRNKIELIIEETLRNVSYEEYEKSLGLFKIVSPGCIDTAYLKPGFDNYFFHINDDLYIFYDCETEDNIWTANKGIIKVKYINFVNEFKLFVYKFMNDMEKRINETICFLKVFINGLKLY